MQPVVRSPDDGDKSAQIKLLTDWLSKWQLTPTQGAKVLRIQKSKMSEFLNPKSDRNLPRYIAAHIETFYELSDDKAIEIITKSLEL